MKIDLVAGDTEAWLSGTRAFLDACNQAVSAIGERELEELKRRARSHNWDAPQYFAEEDVLLDKFHHWLPRLATYSVVILLHSLVETQLHAYAGRLQRERNLPLTVSDIQGKGVEQAKRYILKVASLSISSDPGWQTLGDLVDLRNIIVHRRGRRGSAASHQNTFERLVRRYGDHLAVQKLYSLADPVDDELLVTGACVPTFWMKWQPSSHACVERQVSRRRDSVRKPKPMSGDQEPRLAPLKPDVTTIPEELRGVRVDLLAAAAFLRERARAGEFQVPGFYCPGKPLSHLTTVGDGPLLDSRSTRQGRHRR